MNGQDELERIKQHHGERACRPILYGFGFYAITSLWLLVLTLESGIHPLYMMGLVASCTGTGLLMMVSMGTIQEEMDTAGTRLMIAQILAKQRQARIIGWIPRQQDCATCLQRYECRRVSLFEPWGM